MTTITAARAASRASNSSDSALADFDAATNPIIATHFYGLRPIGEVIVPIIQRIENLQEVSNAPA